MKIMKINADVSFDFITDKMLKIDERIIYAQRLIYNDSASGSYFINKVVTVDDRGCIRAYIKDLQNNTNYLQIGKL